MRTDRTVFSRRAAFALAVGCLAWVSHFSVASADTTSWVVESVEWLADAYDAILVVRALPPDGEPLAEVYPRGTIREGKYPVETIEVLKDHPKAPGGRFLLQKPSGDRPRPGDKLIVFYRPWKDEFRPEEFINTSQPNELIHFPRDPERRKTYACLGMDATGEVIETHDELVRRLRERLKLEAPPISRAEEMRIRLGWTESSAGFERRLADDYESFGYDVIIDVLIPLDRHILDQLEDQGRKYTTPPTTYLGSQGIVRFAEAKAEGEPKNSSLARIELAAEKNSPEVALAWARKLQPRAGRTVRHSTPAASGYARQHSYLLSPDGTRLYHFWYDGIIAIELATGEELYRATGEKLYYAKVSVAPTTALFSPDGRYLAWHDMDSIAAMDMARGELLFHEERAGYVASLLFTGNGRRLGYLARRDNDERRLVLRDLADRASAMEAQLAQLKGRVVLNDLGDTGRYAVLQQEEPRADQSGLSDPQLLLVETKTGQTVLRLPGDIVHAAVGSNDRVIATLSARARSALEEDDTAGDVRELMFRVIDEDEPLLRADIPARFERCVYLTDDLLAVCTAVDSQEQEALLFSLLNDDRRGEVLRWTP